MVRMNSSHGHLSKRCYLCIVYYNLGGVYNLRVYNLPLTVENYSNQVDSIMIKSVLKALGSRSCYAVSIIYVSMIYLLSFDYLHYVMLLICLFMYHLFTIGDWNAKVRIQETPRVTGKFGLGMWNEAGQRLIEFCQENALVIANTLFQQHKGRLYTWTSPDGRH